MLEIHYMRGSCVSLHHYDDDSVGYYPLRLRHTPDPDMLLRHHTGREMGTGTRSDCNAHSIKALICTNTAVHTITPTTHLLQTQKLSHLVLASKWRDRLALVLVERVHHDSAVVDVDLAPVSYTHLTLPTKRIV